MESNLEGKWTKKDNEPTSTKSGLWEKILVNTGLRAKKALEPNNAKIWKVLLAIKNTTQYRDDILKIQEYVLNVHEALSKLAKLDFLDIWEGHTHWINKYIPPLNSSLLGIINSLKIPFEEIKTLWKTQPNVSILEVMFDITELIKDIEAISSGMRSIWENPGVIREGLLKRKKEMEAEQGSEKEKNPSESTIESTAWWADIKKRGDRSMVDSHSLELIRTFFPENIYDSVIHAKKMHFFSRSLSPSEKGKELEDSIMAILDICVKNLNQELAELEKEKKNAELDFTSRIKGLPLAKEEVSKKHDKAKQRLADLHKTRTRHSEEQNTASFNLSNLQSEVEKKTRIHSNLSNGRGANEDVVISEVDFDIPSVTANKKSPEVEQHPDRIVKIDHSALAIAAQEMKEAMAKKEKTEKKKEEEKRLVRKADFMIPLATEMISTTSKALEEETVFSEQIEDIVRQMKKDQEWVQAFRKKRLAYSLAGTTTLIAVVGALIFRIYFYDPTEEPEEIVPKKVIPEEKPQESAPAPIVKNTVSLTPPPIVEKKELPAEKPAEMEKPLTKAQLPTEVISVLFESGYEPEDSDFSEITDVLVEVIGETLLAIPSAEKRKRLIESVLITNFRMHSMQARKELGQYLSNEMRNGTLAVRFEPWLYREIFSEIEKHDWSGFTTEQRIIILDKALHRKGLENARLPPKTNIQAIEEIIVIIEITRSMKKELPENTSH